MQVIEEIEELELKKRARRRLVGAVVLVLLVVTLVPLVLDNEPRPIGDDVEINIISNTKIQGPKMSEDSGLGEESDTVSQSVSDENSSISAQGQGEIGSLPATDRGAGYVVRLGLFSKESGVKSYVEKLENGGFSVITERIETTKGPRTLVLVGVFASKNQAELALERLNARKLTYGDAKIRQRKP